MLCDMFSADLILGLLLSKLSKLRSELNRTVIGRQSHSLV